MSIVPVNVARVSQHLKAFQMLNSVTARQVDLFRTQTQLATGLRFQTPSEDPGGATAVGVVDRQLDRLSQVKNNLRTADDTVLAAETAMNDAVDLMREAKRVTVEAVNDTIGAEERESLATVIGSITDQLISVANRDYLGNYLFSGHKTDQLPYARALDGVEFYGDEGRRQTIIDTDLSEDYFTVSGMDFFGAVATPVAGQVDLDPALTPDTRIKDLRTLNGVTPQLGRIIVSDGVTPTEIDLSHAATIDDVIDTLNDRMPGGLVASIENDHLRIDGGGAITVLEASGGSTAFDLGLLNPAPAGPIIGGDLNPRVTPRTELAALNGGAGINLAGGITIRNGINTKTIDFAGTTTIEDVLNRINRSDIGAQAKINAAGTGIDIVNRVSGTDLHVEENGGSAATNLGVRTIAGETRLSDINLGRGFETSIGNDVRITTRDGSVLEFDLDGVQTIQDVIDAFNAGGGGAITATLGTHNNGITITDNTAGAGTISAEAIDAALPLSQLGLNVSDDGTGRLVGNNITPVRVESAFTSLVEIHRALLENDTQALSLAGERLETVLSHMGGEHGKMAARSKSMDERLLRVDSLEANAKVLKSDIQDADITEVAVEFQQIQTALQANLQISSTVLNLSLLDFMR
jgi:flagellar hook-associated protein 3 FlgL